MVINIFLILLGLGGLSVLYRGLRFQNVLAICFAVLLTGELWYFLHNWQIGSVDSFSYHWLTSRYYPVSIDFISNAINYALIAPFFCAAVMCTFIVSGDTDERQKLDLCSVTALHLAALIMLLTAQNTIQILVSTCFIDVLGCFLINNIRARRQYIFYNLLADMGLFMSFAMLWGDCSSNLLDRLPTCLRHGHDFALWLILLSSVVKSGLFPFQGYWMPVTALNTSRRNILCFLSTPICGFLILYKTYAFFPVSFGLADILRGLSLCSILWGLIGALWIKRLANKKMYISLMFYGLAYGLLPINSGLLTPLLGELYLLHLVLNMILNYSRYRFGAVTAAVLLVASGIIVTIMPIATIESQIYLAAFVMSIGCLIPQLYSQDNEYASMLGLMFAGAVGSYLLYTHMPFGVPLYYCVGVLILLAVLQPDKTEIWQRLYNWPKLQSSEFFATCFYILVVAPIEFLGRILWLTIDFLIIERTVLGSLADNKQKITHIYIWLHDSDWRGTIIFFVIGIIMICGSIYWGK